MERTLVLALSASGLSAGEVTWRQKRKVFFGSFRLPRSGSRFSLESLSDGSHEQSLARTSSRTSSRLQGCPRQLAQGQLGRTIVGQRVGAILAKMARPGQSTSSAARRRMTPGQRTSSAAPPPDDTVPGDSLPAAATAFSSARVRLAGGPRQRSGSRSWRFRSVEKGPAFRLARTGFPHGRAQAVTRRVVAERRTPRSGVDGLCAAVREVNGDPSESEGLQNPSGAGGGARLRETATKSRSTLYVFPRSEAPAICTCGRTTHCTHPSTNVIRSTMGTGSGKNRFPENQRGKLEAAGEPRRQSRKAPAQPGLDDLDVHLAELRDRSLNPSERDE